MEYIKLILSSPIYFFGTAFFIMLVFVGITELITAWRMREAKKIVRQIVDAASSEVHRHWSQHPSGSVYDAQAAAYRQLIEELEIFIEG